MTLEVVWNGAIDHAWAAAQHRPAPPEPDPYVPALALPDAVIFKPGTAGMRVLEYVAAHPGLVYTSRTVAAGLDMDRRTASVILRRAMERGALIQDAARAKKKQRRGLEMVYRAAEVA